MLKRCYSNLSHSIGPKTLPLLQQTIGQNLKQTVYKYRNNDALIVRHQGYRATYGEFWDQVTEAAKSLIAIGVKKGDRVGIWSGNRFEWVILQYATARVGAIMVAINPGYQGPELEYALQQSGTSVLFHPKSFKNINYQKLLNSIKKPTIDKSYMFETDWHHFIQQNSRVSDSHLEEIEAELLETEPINIQYTSGTTGKPKGATLSHRNILNNGYFTGKMIDLSSKDRICIPVPFYHCFGMVLANLACTSTGATMVIPSEWFNPKASLETIEREKCTALYGVPTMMIATLDDPDFNKFDLTSLRTGLMAGSTCPIDLMRQVVDKLHMPEVSIAYGMTETSPISCQTKVTDPLEMRVSSVGCVHPNVEIKIVDPADGRTVERNMAGELCTKGYSVMVGYYRNDEATKKSIDSDGWMHSGDLAVMDDQGYVKIVGRIKDMIIRGGENIYPREIEEALHLHPAISEAQVVGLASEYYGEELCCWIRLKDGEKIEHSELQSFLQDKLADFKIPKLWKFVDQFPMTVTGKVQKFVMREESSKEFAAQLRSRKHE